MKQFDSSDEIIISGLVGAPGAWASGWGDDRYLYFELEGWKVKGDKQLNKEPLEVRKLVDEEESDILRSKIISYTTVLIKVKVSKENINGAPEALLTSIISFEHNDEELNELSRELQKPVTFDDPELGRFTLDRDLDCFEGQIQWMSDFVDLSLEIEDCDERDVLEYAKEIWRSQSDWSKLILDYAVEYLLSRKNDSWLKDGEKEVDADEFKSRMKLTSITVFPEGEFEFWHNDSDLFWGHSILISGSISEGLTDADIPG